MTCNIPEILYHVTSKQNRESILQSGLLTEYSQAHEAIYFSDSLNEEDKGEGFDIWAIKTDSVENYFDEDNDMYFVDTGSATWYAYYNNIPPNKIYLFNTKLKP